MIRNSRMPFFRFLPFLFGADDSQAVGILLQQRDIDIARHAQVGEDSLQLSVLRHHNNAVFHSLLRRMVDDLFPSSRISPVLALSAPMRARMTSVRPAPTRPEKPRISPLCRVKDTFLT